MATVGLPVPPPDDFVVNQTGQAILTYAQIIPVTICLAIAFRLLARRRDPAMLLCLLGGLVAGLCEPTLDVSTNVWLGSPAQGQWAAFDTLGHPFPLWTLGSYTWYVGGQGFLVYHLLTSRGLARGRRMVWLCLYTLRPRLTRWRALLIVALGPIVAGGVWGGTLFPVANAQNGATPLPMLVIQLAGIATVALAVLCVWLVSQILPRSGQTTSTLTSQAHRYLEDSATSS